MASSLLNDASMDNVKLASTLYRQTKAALGSFITLLGGNISIVQGSNILDAVNQRIQVLQAYVADPGFNAAAQYMYSDGTFDPITALNTMITDLQNVATWITTNMNIPVYTPAQTAPLLTLVQKAYNDAV